MPDFSAYADPIGAELEYLRKRAEGLQAELGREPVKPRPALDVELAWVKARIRALIAEAGAVARQEKHERPEP